MRCKNLSAWEHSATLFKRTLEATHWLLSKPLS
jgi:hypothetical protein